MCKYNKKFQKEVFQMIDEKFPCAILLGSLSIYLNHWKIHT